MDSQSLQFRIQSNVDMVMARLAHVARGTHAWADNPTKILFFLSLTLPPFFFVFPSIAGDGNVTAPAQALIDRAMDPHLLARMEPLWQPWL